MRWLERQRYFIDFTIASLRRRKGKNVSLILVYTLVIFNLASVLFLTQAIKNEAVIVLDEAPEMVVQRIVAGRHDLIPVHYADQIKTIRGVSSVRPKLWGYYFDTIFGANYTLMVPEEFAHEDGNIIIGAGVAEAALGEVDNILPFWDHRGNLTSYNIREILSTDSELVSSDLILISETDFRQLFGIEESYATDLSVRVRNEKELPIIAAKIKKMLPDTRPITRDEILRTYDSIFNWRSGILLVILVGSGLAFIIFAWDKASGLSAEEKKEIGILKALGWETSDIIMMKFWEGTAISLTSFLLGLLLAYGHVFFTSSILFSPALKGWAVIYPEFKLVPYIDIYLVSILFCLTVLPYTVSTIVPSWRTAIVDPDTVLRT